MVKSTPVYLLESTDPTDYNWLIIYLAGTRTLRHPGISINGTHLLHEMNQPAHIV